MCHTCEGYKKHDRKKQRRAGVGRSGRVSCLARRTKDCSKGAFVPDGFEGFLSYRPGNARWNSRIYARPCIAPVAGCWFLASGLWLFA